jgi:hypothetical protein
MKIENLRKQHHKANSKLCRSRHLFYSMYYGDLIRFIGNNKDSTKRMLALAIFMRTKGLYAASSSYASITMSVARNLARVREERTGKSQDLWVIFHESRVDRTVMEFRKSKQAA